MIYYLRMWILQSDPVELIQGKIICNPRCKVNHFKLNFFTNSCLMKSEGDDSNVNFVLIFQFCLILMFNNFVKTFD